MPGIIFDIKRFAVHDGPGIRTTVFMKGCPLRCRWCHNPEGWLPDPCTVWKKVKLDKREFTEKESIGRIMTADEVMTELEKERLVMEESGGGITFSGGEPLMQPQFLKELLQRSAGAGFHTAVDTSGYCLRSNLEEILPWTSLFLYDLKIWDTSRHEQFTGVPNRLILENFRWLTEQGKMLRVRIPLIAGVTMTEENLTKILKFLLPYTGKIEQVDLLPYHRTGLNKYAKLGILCEMPGEEGKPGKEEISACRMNLEREGFRVKIGG